MEYSLVSLEMYNSTETMKDYKSYYLKNNRNKSNCVVVKLWNTNFKVIRIFFQDQMFFYK